MSDDVKFELLEIKDKQSIEKFYKIFTAAMPYLHETIEMFDPGEFVNVISMLHDRILRNDLKFWHYEDKAFCMHEETRNPNYKDLLRINMAMGRNANYWIHSFLDEVEKYARENKFDRIELWGRLGWERFKARSQEDDHGYHVSRIVYKKNVYETT